jgi:dihydropteroate synthase
MLWSFRNRTLKIGPRPLVMGIVNVTPDSFSDGGRHSTTDAAIQHALKLESEGADFLDVGGESSRPGSQRVSLDEELARVLPVVRALSTRSIPISVDTTKAEVARQALAAGAHIVNDITAGLGDPGMIGVVSEFDAGAVLMHMQGTPETMQDNPTYGDVAMDVRDFLQERVNAWVAAGVPFERLAIDPGISFGKTFEHNLQLLKHLDALVSIHRPILLGVSRKGFLGKITGRPITERAVASVTVGVYCAARGTAHILRVHDVAETSDAAKVVGAIGDEGLLRGV